MDTDVVIVGAGPTGLLAALLLHRCGIRPRILDKNDQSAHESRAFVVQPKSLELLLSIGLADAFLRRGLIAPGVQMVVNGHPRAELNMDDLGATDTPFSFLFMLPQNEIEEIFLDELAREGLEVERRCEVTSLSQDERGVRLETTKGEMRAAYVIGADGAHSIVRKALGLRFEGGAYPQTFLLADCAMEWPFDHEHVKIFFRGSALALYLPLREAGFGRVLTVERDGRAPDSEAARTSTTSETVTLEEVEASLRAAAGPNVRLTRPRWTTRYRIHHRGVDRYGVGRVFVAGDAAHIHSPVGGQGMNTGLQDAANLCWKIAAALRGHGGAALLDTYHAERHPVGQRLLSFTDRAFSIVSDPGFVSTRVRNFLAPKVLSFLSHTNFRAKAFRFVSQLGIRYETNAFVREDAPGRSGPRAGHRAPNAAISRHRDVFDLIRGYRFHVLALCRKPMRTEEIARTRAALSALPAGPGVPVEAHFIGHSSVGEDPRLLQAESTQVFTTYGLDDRDASALFLVRPDGYVAYRSAGLETAGLAAFLRAFALG